MINERLRTQELLKPQGIQKKFPHFGLQIRKIFQFSCFAWLKSQSEKTVQILFAFEPFQNFILYRELHGRPLIDFQFLHLRLAHSTPLQLLPLWLECLVHQLIILQLYCQE